MKRKLQRVKFLIRYRILRWLGLNDAVNRLDAHEFRLDNASRRLSMIYDKMLLGVDFEKPGIRPGSWAVICIQGKEQDLVRFYDLTDQELRFIRDFLRQFDYRNRTIDHPFGRQREYKDDIF